MANNKRNYEATLVLDTRGSKDSADAMISKVSEIIVALDGDVKKVENLGGLMERWTSRHFRLRTVYSAHSAPPACRARLPSNR